MIIAVICLKEAALYIIVMQYNALNIYKMEISYNINQTLTYFLVIARWYVLPITQYKDCQIF